ncbi:MAG: FprA family A-type flavoprotein [Rikenellaceae bacterium]|nr:FprA family A-type flavoprotein [Rikenellaceae bacterium]
MFFNVEVTGKVHWIGTNDRRKHRFENLWPLPFGISYNSYVIADQKTALVDTIEMGTDGSYLGRLESILEGRDLDYLIINHMEPDHSGEIATILRRFPQVTIVGNNKTFNILKNYFGELPKNLLEVKDGDQLDLGYHKLRFYMTPWVHWPETMMTYDQTEKILFSGDAFGTFGTLDGGILDRDTKFDYYENEMRRYYSNIVGKYGNMVQKALAKLEGVSIQTICSLHGPVWQENVSKVVGLYDKWSKCETENALVVIYASMYGNGAHMADYIANVTSRSGVRDIRVYDVSKTHISYLISEIWRCRGVMLGSCAYNTELFPLTEQLCTEILHYGVKDRLLGIFGSCSWNGGGVRNLRQFAEKSGWELVCEPVEMLGCADEEKYAACDTLAKTMARKLLNK